MPETIAVDAGTYTKRWTFTYPTIDNESTKVDIYDLYYTGEPEEINAGSTPLQIKFDKANDGYFTPLKFTSVVIQLMAETNFQFFDVYTYDNEQFLIDITKELAAGGGYQNHWRGFITPEQYFEPYLSTPYATSVYASDGLNLLKNKPFDITGEQTLAYVIYRCLYQTGIRYDFYEYLDIYEDSQSQTSSDSALAQTYVDCNLAFYDEDGVALKYGEVLDEILFSLGAQIIQSGGAWHIIKNVADYSGGAIIGRRFQYGLYVSDTTYDFRKATTTSAENDKTVRLRFTKRQQQLELNPAWKSFTLEQDYGLRDNMLKNGNFAQYETDALYLRFTSITNWTKVGTGNYPIFGKNGDEIMMLWENIVSYDTTRYLESDALSLLGTSDKLIITINYWTTSNTTSARFMVKYGAYTLKLDSGDYVWDNVATNYIDLTLNDNFEEFEIITDNLPSDDDLQIRLYNSEGSGLLNGLWIKDIYIKLIDSNQAYYPTGLTSETSISSKYPYIPSVFEMKLGDVEAKDNAFAAYGGKYFLSDGSLTDNWIAKDTSVEGTLHEILILSIAQLTHRPQLKLRGVFVGILSFIQVIQLSDLNNILFRLESATIDDKMNEITFEAIELLEPNIIYPPDIILKENLEPIGQEVDVDDYMLMEAQP